MPEPMTPPITIIVASNRPSFAANCAGLDSRGSVSELWLVKIAVLWRLGAAFYQQLGVTREYEPSLGRRERKYVIFSDVWQTKDFKSNVFVSVANKGLRRRFCVSVAGKGLSGILRRGERVVERRKADRKRRADHKNVLAQELRIVKRKVELRGGCRVVCAALQRDKRAGLCFAPGASDGDTLFALRK